MFSGAAIRHTVGRHTNQCDKFMVAGTIKEVQIRILSAIIEAAAATVLLQGIIWKRGGERGEGCKDRHGTGVETNKFFTIKLK